MKVSKRRRREGKTDYLVRKNILKSQRPRIVFRKTNRYVTAQYVESIAAQDKIIIGINSKILLGYGWPKENQGSLKTIPASYLMGLLMGKKIIEKKLDLPAVDFGMLRTIHKNNLFAFLKGLGDSGLKIKVAGQALPSEDRIMGERLTKKINFNE